MEKDIADIVKNFSIAEKKLFLQAFEFAQKAHQNQKRKSGEPFIVHPVAVAKDLWKKYGDTELATAGLLHDVVEDCEKISIKNIHDTFGENIGFLVDSSNKRKNNFYNKIVIFEDKVERLLWAGMQDIRVLLLKLADREHNINTLKYLKKNKQVRMAFETQAIFEPLKKILKYNKKQKIKEIENNFQKYLIENNFSSPKDVKKNLHNMSFKDLSHEMFELVYNNSDRVVWEIENKQYLKELSKDKKIEEHVNIEYMWTDGKKFKASFTFDKGFILDPDVGLKVSSYKQK